MSELDIVRHETEQGRWEYVYSRPAPALRRYVQQYQGYVEVQEGVLSRTEVPRPHSSIIVNLGTPLRVQNSRTGAWSEHARSFIAGLSDFPVTTESHGFSAGIEVRFTPVGAFAFLGVPAHSLGEKVHDLSVVLGPLAELLTEKLAELPDWQSRFQLLDAFITHRLSRVPLPAQQVEAAYNALVRSQGQVSVAALADACGWSEKHLVQRFREQIGLTPKTMARVIRFNRALNLIESGNPPPLTEIALSSGYYDQSHMTREFRDFAGAAPSQLLQRSLPPGAGFQAG